ESIADRVFDDSFDHGRPSLSWQASRLPRRLTGAHFPASAFARAFCFSTVASVRAEFSFASSWQPAQQRNTGLPSSTSLTGLPIRPSRLSRSTTQYFWASARRRSSGLSLFRLALIFASFSGERTGLP